MKLLLGKEQHCYIPYYIKFVNVFFPKHSILFPIPRELYYHLAAVFNNRWLVNEHVCYARNAVFFRMDDGVDCCMLTDNSLDSMYEASWGEFTEVRQQARKQGWVIEKVVCNELGVLTCIH